MAYEQTNQDGLYIEDSYFTPDGYFVYVAEAQAAMSVVGNVTADVGVIRSAASAMSVTTTVVASLANIQGVDMFAFSNAALAADVQRIRDYNIATSSQFSVAVDAVRGIYVSAQADSVASLSADFLRARTGEAATSAAFSVSITAENIKGFDATLQSTVTQSTVEEYIRGYSADLQVTATQFTVEEYIRGAVANIASEFTLTSTISHIEGADLQAFANASLTVTSEITKPATCSITSTSTLTFIGYITNKRPRNLIQTGSLITTSTTQKLLGTHSLYIPDSATGTDFVRTQATSDFTIPSSTDFIIEFYFRPSQFLVGNFITIRDNSDQQQLGIGRYNIADDPGKPSLRAQWVDINNQSQNLSHTSQLTSGYDWIYCSLTRVGTTLSLTYRTRNSSTLVWSSALTTTRTYSQQIGYSQTNLRLKFGQDGGGFGGYIDEFYIAKGTGQTQQFISGAPERNTVGNDSTTLALYHFDGDYVDDMTGIARANAVLSAVATLSADVRKFGIVSFDSAMSSTASITAVAIADKTLDAALSSQGFLVTAFGRIRPFVDISASEFTLTADIVLTASTAADLSSTATVAATVTKDIGPITSDMSAVSSLSATAQVTSGVQAQLSSEGFLVSAFGRIRPFVDASAGEFSLAVDASVANEAAAGLTSAFSQTATVVKILGPIEANLTSAFSQTTNATIIPSGSVAMSSAFSTSVINGRLRDNAVTATAAVLVVADAIKVTVVDGQLSAQATLAATSTRIKQLDSAFQAIATELVAAARTGSALVDIQTQATLIANAVSLPSGSVAMSSETTTSIEYNRIRSTSVSISSAFVPVVNVTTSNDAAANMTVVATLTITSRKTASAASAMITPAFGLTVVANKRTDVISLAASLGTLSLVPGRIRNQQSQITARSTLTVLAGRRINAQSIMLVQGFVLATGELLYIDPDLIYMVPRERRDFIIRKETRILTIDQEQREYIVRGK